MEQLLSIGRAADAVGVAPSALRHYDHIGLAPPTARIGGRRRYSDGDLARLRLINHCRQAGFTLDEIATLLDGDEAWQPLARRKREELRDRIAELTRAARLVEEALACGCERLEACAAHDPHAAEHVLPPVHPLTDPTRALLPGRPQDPSPAVPACAERTREAGEGG